VGDVQVSSTFTAGLGSDAGDAKLLSFVQSWPISSETRNAQQAYIPDTRALLAAQYDVYVLVPHLWKARVLMFRGDANPVQPDYADRLVKTYSRYHDPRAYLLFEQVRPSEQLLESIGASPSRIESLRFSKRNANYWLGLLAYQDGDYRVAEDFFDKRTLEPSQKSPNPWTSGARYNLARTHEQRARQWRHLRKAEPIKWPKSTLPAAALTGRYAPAELPSPEKMKIREAEQLAAAIKLLEAEQGPNRHGNRLRAKWLSEIAAE
jgi:hypothetical protein